MIVDSLIGLKETFDDYSNNIIIIVTKTDDLEEGKKREIENYIYQKTGLDKIIFSTKNTQSY